MPLAVDAVDHLVVNVRDVDVAAAWYQRVLGMVREDFDRAGDDEKVGIVQERQELRHRGRVVLFLELQLAEEALVGILALDVRFRPAAGRQKDEHRPEKRSHDGPYYRGAGSFGNRPLSGLRRKASGL